VPLCEHTAPVCLYTSPSNHQAIDISKPRPR
jgi:hypothetical protein